MLRAARLCSFRHQPASSSFTHKKKQVIYFALPNPLFQDRDLEASDTSVQQLRAQLLQLMDRLDEAHARLEGKTGVASPVASSSSSAAGTPPLQKRHSSAPHDRALSIAAGMASRARQYRQRSEYSSSGCDSDTSGLRTELGTASPHASPPVARRDSGASAAGRSFADRWQQRLPTADALAMMDIGLQPRSDSLGSSSKQSSAQPAPEKPRSMDVGCQATASAVFKVDRETQTCVAQQSQQQQEQPMASAAAHSRSGPDSSHQAVGASSLQETPTTLTCVRRTVGVQTEAGSDYNAVAAQATLMTPPADAMLLENAHFAISPAAWLKEETTFAALQLPSVPSSPGTARRQNDKRPRGLPESHDGGSTSPVSTQPQPSAERHRFEWRPRLAFPDLEEWLQATTLKEVAAIWSCARRDGIVAAGNHVLGRLAKETRRGPSEKMLQSWLLHARYLTSLQGMQDYSPWLAWCAGCVAAAALVSSDSRILPDPLRMSLVAILPGPL